MKPILTLNLMLAATLSVKSAPADETAAVNPTQSKPMAGMMEMMSPQPGFRLYGWIETGITGNFASPNDNQNFGRLLNDRANEPLLNQFVLTAERGLNCCDGKVGVTINPPKPALITDLMIRPELRYDRSLNGTHPFNDSSDQDMFTAAVDFVVTF